MPAAEEKLQEAMPFDVYAMLLIISCVATLTAVCILWAELRQNWYGAEPPGVPKAVYLSSLNQPAGGGAQAAECDWLVVNASDLDDAKALNIKVDDVKEFPVWSDPLKHPVKAELDADNTKDVPPEELSKLKEEYVSQKDPTVEAPVTAPPAPPAP